MGLNGLARWPLGIDSAEPQPRQTTRSELVKRPGRLGPTWFSFGLSNDWKRGVNRDSLSAQWVNRMTCGLALRGARCLALLPLFRPSVLTAGPGQNLLHFLCQCLRWNSREMRRKRQAAAKRSDRRMLGVMLRAIHGFSLCLWIIVRPFV